MHDTPGMAVGQTFGYILRNFRMQLKFVEALEVVILIYETQEVLQTVQLLVLTKWREVEVNILQHDSAWSWALKPTIFGC